MPREDRLGRCQMLPEFNSVPARGESEELKDGTIAPNDPGFTFGVIPRKGADIFADRGAAWFEGLNAPNSI